jgi:hypothetical protein
VAVEVLLVALAARVEIQRLLGRVGPRRLEVAQVDARQVAVAPLAHHVLQRCVAEVMQEAVGLRHEVGQLRFLLGALQVGERLTGAALALGVAPSFEGGAELLPVLVDVLLREFLLEGAV